MDQEAGVGVEIQASPDPCRHIDLEDVVERLLGRIAIEPFARRFAGQIGASRIDQYGPVRPAEAEHYGRIQRRMDGPPLAQPLTRAGEEESPLLAPLVVLGSGDQNPVRAQHIGFDVEIGPFQQAGVARRRIDPEQAGFTGAEVETRHEQPCPVRRLPDHGLTHQDRVHARLVAEDLSHRATVQVVQLPHQEFDLRDAEARNRLGCRGGGEHRVFTHPLDAAHLGVADPGPGQELAIRGLRHHERAQISGHGDVGEAIPRG